MAKLADQIREALKAFASLRAHLSADRRPGAGRTWQDALLDVQGGAPNEG